MTEKTMMPWEDPPAGRKDVMLRYSQNPVSGRSYPDVKQHFQQLSGSV